MRKRAQSQIILDSSLDLDFNVLTYSKRDPAVHKALGLNCKEVEWKVQCRNSNPLDIKVTFDKNITGRIEVRVTCNDDKVFPVGPSADKSRLIEDFQQTWPFRGIAKGINETHYVEVKLFHNGQDTWFPGTVLQQSSDGFFQVMVTKPGIGGYFNDELYPFVSKKDLREAATKQPYLAPERQLILTVPKDSTMELTRLIVDGGTDITQFFGRPTPNWESNVPKIMFTVNEDRSVVSGSIGHRELLQHWNGEVNCVDCIPKRPGILKGYGSKMWKIMVGLCLHTIEVERKYTSSKIVTLTVDGVLLVEALAEDVNIHDGSWQASFRLVGEPAIEFEVFETDPFGSSVGKTGCVEQKRPFKRVCVVSLENLSDLSSATLHVDGVEYKELPLNPEGHAQGNITISPTVMVSQYHIQVPFKINKEAAAKGPAYNNIGALLGIGNNVQYGDGQDPRHPQGEGIFSYLMCCCSQATHREQSMATEVVSMRTDDMLADSPQDELKGSMQVGAP